MRCQKQRTKYAGVAELADALDLGSSVSDMQVRPLSPAPFLFRGIFLLTLCIENSEKAYNNDEREYKIGEILANR